jgi:hypothetical protein
MLAAWYRGPCTCRSLSRNEDLASGWITEMQGRMDCISIMSTGAGLAKIPLGVEKSEIQHHSPFLEC